MKRYETSSVRIKASFRMDVMNAISNKGADGWELKAVIPDDERILTCVFQREAPESEGVDDAPRR